MPTYVTPGVYYERADAGARADRAAAHRHRRLRRHRRARAARRRRCRSSRWRQFVALLRRRSPARATSPTRCAASSRTAAAAAGSCASPRRPRGRIGACTSPPAPRRRRVAASSASSPGVWGNDLDIAWRETHRAQTVGGAGRESTPDYVDGRVGRRASSAARSCASASARRAASYPRRLGRRCRARSALYWVNPSRGDRLPYEQPLAGFDPDAAAARSRASSTRCWCASRDGWSRVVRRAVAGAGASALRPGRAGAARRRSIRGVRPSDDLGAAAERRSAGRPTRRPIPSSSSSCATAPRSRSCSRCSPTVARRGALTRRRGRAVAAHGRATSSASRRCRLDADEIAPAQARAACARSSAVDEIALVAVPDIHIQPAAPPRSRAAAALRCPIRACRRRRSARRRRAAESSAICRRVSRADRSSRVQAALVEHCERRGDRFALLDPPFEARVDDRARHRRRCAPGAGASTRTSPRSTSRGSRSPIRCDARRDRLRAIPPSGHVAGFIAADRPARSACTRRRPTARSPGCRTSTLADRRRAARRAQPPSTSTRSARSRAAACASSARARCRAIPTGASSTCAGCC